MTTQRDVVSLKTAISTINAFETLSLTALDCKHVISTEGALSSTQTVHIYVSCSSVKLHFTFPLFIITKCPSFRSKFMAATGHHFMNKFQTKYFLLSMEERLAHWQNIGVRSTKFSLTVLYLYCDNYNQILFNWNAVGGQMHNWDIAYIIKCWIDNFIIVSFGLIDYHTILFGTLSVWKKYENAKSRPCVP